MATPTIQMLLLEDLCVIHHPQRVLGHFHMVGHVPILEASELINWDRFEADSH